MNCKSFPAGALLWRWERTLLGFLGCRAIDSGKAFTWNGPAAFNHFAGYDKFLDSFLRRQGVHRVQQEFFENHHQAAGATLASNRLSRSRLERVFGELAFHISE